MRLLKLGNHDDTRLTTNLINNIPPYAILSHTWGADEDEVTFSDLQNGSGQTKIGHCKIDFCGRQAKKDGLQNFWVDTCCIDKANHTELSEAIASMYRWYRDAEKCYVYLSDVSTRTKNQTLIKRTWKADFRKSKWFTRGWTLQELIAPRVVEFFSKEGDYLGDKHSLEQSIHEITSIPIDVLRGQTLSQLSVAERFRWAEKRHTTRKEDKAYCLLGIFNVYIPLIYGEGDHAYTRLKEEIDKSSKDRPNVPPSPSLLIPFRRDRDFVERDVLNDVWQRAFEPGARIGLVGLGGVGKTQLAIEYAHRCREANPKLWVFWVHASSAARFEESYKKIAERLQLPGWNEPKADILDMVSAWLSNESNGQWAMVVDNADSHEVMFEPQNCGTTTQTKVSAPLAPSSPTDHSLSYYLPISANGSIVITSRNREVVEGLIEYGGDILDVEPMDTKDAITLLTKKLQRQERGISHDNLVRLVQQLDCIPLAITQAAAYINQRAPRITVAKYLEGLERSDDDRTKLLQQDIRDLRRDGQASNSIITTWHVSFEHIRQTRESAARLLALMCLFDREGIPDNLLQGRYSEEGSEEQSENRNNVDKDDLEDDIAILRAYSLISIGVSDYLFNMHRLVQFSTKKWLEIHSELPQWQERYVSILDEAFPKVHYATWPICQALFPHVEAIMSYIVQSEDHIRGWAAILYRGARYAARIGRYGVAEEMIRASLAVREKVLGFDHSQTLDSVNDLASVLRGQGKYKQAEEMHRRALTEREKTLGLDHLRTLTSVNNLALVLQDQGKYEQAEEMQRRALIGREKGLEVDIPTTRGMLV